MTVVHRNKTGFDATLKPTAIDIAWAAGIYEGEGSCVASGEKASDGSRRSFAVNVPQKDPEILYKLCGLFGGRISLFNVKSRTRFPIYHWVNCGDRARAFLTAIYPFLTAKRKAQINATRVSIFLEEAQEFLVLPVVDVPCQRYEAICATVQNFTGVRRAAADKKRYEYLKNYYQQPDYKEKNRLKKYESRKLKKEQSLKVVEIKKTA